MTAPFTTHYFEDLRVGMRETLMKTVMNEDVIGFANLSGDHNPIHLSEHFARKTRFGERIAHGLYTASLISAVLGTRLPGPGAVYRSQSLNFHAPVKIGVRGGAVYVESHRDIYGYTPALFRDASAMIAHAGLSSRVDEQLLLSALEDTSGMPIRISPETSDTGQVVPASATAPEPAPEAERDRAPHTDDAEAGDD